MFENLTQREKILASAFGCMVPIVLLGWGIWSAYTSHQGRNTRIAQLQQQINDERGKRASEGDDSILSCTEAPLAIGVGREVVDGGDQGLRRASARCEAEGQASE